MVDDLKEWEWLRRSEENSSATKTDGDKTRNVK